MTAECSASGPWIASQAVTAQQSSGAHKQSLEQVKGRAGVWDGMVWRGVLGVGQCRVCGASSRTVQAGARTNCKDGTGWEDVIGCGARSRMYNLGGRYTLWC